MAGLLLGSKLPKIVTDSQLGKLHVHDLVSGSWLVLFSVFSDFDATGTTEVGMVSKLQAEFQARGTHVLAIAMDNALRHTSWKEAIDETQTTEVDFPILADEDGKILDSLNMRHKSPDGVPGHVLPSVIIVDPDLTIVFQMSYPVTSGRNFYEILRVLDSLQLSRLYRVATPAHWVAGEDCYVLPSVTDEEATKAFPRGVTHIPAKEPGLPACRSTPYPGPTSAGAGAGAGSGPD